MPTTDAKATATDDRQQIGLRVRSDLRWRLKEAAAGRRMSMEDLLEEILRDALMPVRGRKTLACKN